ncbi:unnamed protein product [Bursaphelenchus okinawaensis]|uniref:Uncharacterized protein n=1 Tax=Bursaphelenchus okinawaensis TaxID=465554 RepID=A0A811L809_9BILA|nr:unnamed protein product [Bursaphelenchus okinawaensis]CAG9117438.1 unnamed protein product [Bursaphelenchus okinawaensis]
MTTQFLLVMICFITTHLCTSISTTSDDASSTTEEALHSMYEFNANGVVQPAVYRGRLQGASVKGRLLCGATPMVGVKVKIVDIDQKPDPDDLLGDVLTDDEGYFHVSGVTREDTDIEVMIKVYHDCDDPMPCQRKVVWKIPSRYHNNGTFVEWFDVGTINMEMKFVGEERDCRH